MAIHVCGEGAKGLASQTEPASCFSFAFPFPVFSIPTLSSTDWPISEAMATGSEQE